MRNIYKNRSGFTAVELLITLFIASMFIIAGYQLFDVIIKDGAEARAESRASNIAYSYMRKYATSATNPCTPQAPISNTDVTENTEGLSGVKVSITISCPQSDARSVSKIESFITYNNPQKSLRFSTFVDASKGASIEATVTDGLVGWWKLNGNGNSELGSAANATATSASATTGQNGKPNSAMNFTSTSSRLTGPSSPELSPATVSFSLWIYPRAWNTTAATGFVFKRSASATGNGYAFGYLTGSSVYADCGSPRWTTGYQPPFNTWTHLVLTCTSSSITLYVNGVQYANRASNTTDAISVGSNAVFAIGNDMQSGNFGFNGYMDDVRVYSRSLSSSEAVQLYTAGAQ